MKLTWKVIRAPVDRIISRVSVEPEGQRVQDVVQDGFPPRGQEGSSERVVGGAASWSLEKRTGIAII